VHDPWRLALHKSDSAAHFVSDNDAHTVLVWLLLAENDYNEVLQYFHPDVVMVNTVCPVDPQHDSGVSTLTGAEQVGSQQI
jgi:hypothetical protein